MTEIDALEVLQEYRTRFYHWALKDIAREVEQDYPLLRTYQSGTMQCYLQFVETLSVSQRILLAEGFFKAQFARNTPVDLGKKLRIGIDARQTGLLQDRMSYLHNHAADSRRQFQAGENYYNYDLDDYNDDLRIEKIMETILSALVPVLGKQDKVKHSTTDAIIEFVTPVEAWYVRTVVYCHQVTAFKYEHQLVVAPGDYDSMFDPTFYCKVILSSTWPGDDSTDYWDLLSGADLPALGTCLSLSCAHFIRSMAPLVAGLPKPSSEAWSPLRYADPFR